MSTMSEVSKELADRLARIATANGFSTNAGLRVFRGRRRLMPQNLPCVVLIEKKATATEQNRGDAKLHAGFVVEGHAECSVDHPNDMGHLLIADIMRAVFTTPDFVYDGGKRSKYEFEGTEIAPRDDGTAHVSATVDLAVEYVIRKAGP